VGAYSAPADRLAGGKGTGCPFPKNSTPAFGLSGISSTALTPDKILRTPLIGRTVLFENVYSIGP